MLDSSAVSRLSFAPLVLAASLSAIACADPDEDDVGADPCDEPPVAMGVFGSVTSISCDSGPNCSSPAVNFTVSLYDENPIVDEMFSPTSAPVAQPRTDSSGEFMVELPPAAYWACSSSDCSNSFVVTDEHPITRVDYSSGNGSRWSLTRCDE